MNQDGRRGRNSSPATGTKENFITGAAAAIHSAASMGTAPPPLPRYPPTPPPPLKPPSTAVLSPHLSDPPLSVLRITPGRYLAGARGLSICMSAGGGGGGGGAGHVIHADPLALPGAAGAGADPGPPPL
ncbi:homeobox protein Hox-D9-like [Schistocerca piceifrons]|uniref:homeobox protein Hox-D9-like n=1 Tax=Schistocerca piceifrons TaxID=274613 RepID=UPI001F5EBC94|nr:homeobox protein Hox-D9-like [Schistocerca piceifrons]